VTAGFPPWWRTIIWSCPACGEDLEETEAGLSCPACGERISYAALAALSEPEEDHDGV
jgi:rubrerythrin